MLKKKKLNLILSLVSIFSKFHLYYFYIICLAMVIQPIRGQIGASPIRFGIYVISAIGFIFCKM